MRGEGGKKRVRGRNGGGRGLLFTLGVSRIEITSSPKADREEWLLIEWPECEDIDQILAFNVAGNDHFRKASHLTKLRWRIERDLSGSQTEVGLGHRRARLGRGFHHPAYAVHRAY